jgi:hypothetical protein
MGTHLSDCRKRAALLFSLQAVNTDNHFNMQVRRKTGVATGREKAF